MQVRVGVPALAEPAEGWSHVRDGNLPSQIGMSFVVPPTSFAGNTAGLMWGGTSR